ncbi:UDP-glucuronic acid decarboxylase family protein [Methylibium sp.]|uniref:UDP-glucuronic acid decarboxylase family protein n=1 Tax=Methylibium sp. TaxID=2067992 RepID=UPI0017F92F7E|nr:UDP-glucuronic acid decarboxylase family protein [Methylibium sp.]MBA3589701.1 SDR family oxidoreductase [Methylibium sp.]
MSSLVLVPGGAGFLGSHLCERLLARGHTVLALDDLSTGHRRHVGHLSANPRFRLLVHDLTRPLPRATRCAARVYNLACPASPAYYQQDPVQTTLTSVLGIWHLLELCQSSGARLLQASTSEVYGDPQVHPQTEDYVGHVNPIGPRACYDEGKRCAETLAFAYRWQRNVEIRVARLFNSYGPRLRPGDGRVVSNFIVQALRGEPLTVYGDGQQTRSFCYVDDTVEGLLKLMDGPIEGPVNLGNPVEHTILELAEAVLRLTGSRSELHRHPLPPDDPRKRRPDISLAQRQLGWAPRVSLEDGLVATIEWFRRELDLPAVGGLARKAA